VLLAAAERRLGIAGKLAALIADPRDPKLVRHSVADILRPRILAIACGYEDGNDLGRLRCDPGFKLARGRLPDSCADLCSQDTVSRLENAPGRREVAMLLRSGNIPSGREVRGQLRRLVRRIRTPWPATQITIRGDGHYGRHEAMAWCEANGVSYIFGLGGNNALDRKEEAAADDVRVRWSEGEHAVVRRYAETRHGAASWQCERRVAARIEASCNGLDIRYAVTKIARGSAEWLYGTLYCERGQAENLSKLHKTQLASDRTSCRSALANQVRLVLHTAAYWLLLTLRDAIPKRDALARAEFKTLRLSLIKVAPRTRSVHQHPAPAKCCSLLPMK
jgi:hypothetical protein